MKSIVKKYLLTPAILLKKLNLNYLIIGACYPPQVSNIQGTMVVLSTGFEEYGNTVVFHDLALGNNVMPYAATSFLGGYGDLRTMAL